MNNKRISKENLIFQNAVATFKLADKYRENSTSTNSPYLGDLEDIARERFYEANNCGYDATDSMLSHQILNQQGVLPKIRDVKVASCVPYGDVQKYYMKVLQDDLMMRTLSNVEDDENNIKYNNQRLITADMSDKEIQLRIAKAMLEAQKNDLEIEFPMYNLDNDYDISTLFNELHGECCAKLSEYFVLTQQLQAVSNYIDRWNVVCDEEEKVIK